MEERKYVREKVNKRALLMLNNRNVNCDVENISCAGTYVRIYDDNVNNVSDTDIGEDVIFSFDIASENNKVRGKILRFDKDASGTFLAVYFLETFQFE